MNHSPLVKQSAVELVVLRVPESGKGGGGAAVSGDGGGDGGGGGEDGGGVVLGVGHGGHSQLAGRTAVTSPKRTSQTSPAELDAPEVHTVLKHLAKVFGSLSHIKLLTI